MNKAELEQLSVYKQKVTRAIKNGKMTHKIWISNREDIEFKDEVYLFTENDLKKFISNENKILKELKEIKEKMRK